MNHGLLMRLFLLFIVVANNLISYSQNKEFTINNGLPHTDASYTVQDKKGFLWFATLDGLCKYDGYKITVFRNNHNDSTSINNNRISLLQYDSLRNGLWIGTESGGLSFMDLLTEKISFLNNAGIPKKITALNLVDKGHLYVNGNSVIKIITLSKNSGTVTGISTVELKPASANITSICTDQHGGLWVGTYDSLYYKPKDGELKPIFSGELSSVNVLTLRANGVMLAGTTKGLYSIDITKLEVKKLNGMNVTAIYSESVNSIWVGTFGNGFFNCFSDGSVNQFYTPMGTPSEPKSIVKNIFKDKSGSLFFSTAGEGIKILHDNNYTFKAEPNNLPAKLFNAVKRPMCFFATDNETILIGTRTSGIAVYDRSKGSVDFLTLIDHDGKDVQRSVGVSALFGDSRRQLWVGSANKVLVLPAAKLPTQSDFANAKSISIPWKTYHVNRFREDKQGRIWVGTSVGLFCFDAKGTLLFASETEAEQSKNPNREVVNDILFEEDSPGQLVVWTAMRTGIKKQHFNSRTLTVLQTEIFKMGKTKSDLYSNWISFLHEDRMHNIWAGTIGGGLSKIIKNNNGQYSFKTITTEDGLLTNDVETMLEDEEGNFWIGSIGLTKYNPVDHYFSYFDANDGLQSNAFKVWAAFKKTDGEMIFGGINGFNIFYPSKVHRLISVAPPQLLSLLVNNEAVKVGESVSSSVILDSALSYKTGIVLPKHIRNFGIEFVSTQSYNGQKIVYRYQLVGYDNEWVYTRSDKRYANYTNLPPGKYVFRVASSGGDGIWNSPSTLAINMTPGFWETKQAYAMVIALLLLGFFLLRRYTLIRLDLKNKLQLDKAAKEHELKNYSDKVEFFTNISHELRTPLSLIKIPVDQLISQANLPEPFHKKLMGVQQNTERLQQLVEQVLDIRKLELGKMELNTEVVNLQIFISNIAAQFEDLLKKKNIRLQVNNDLKLHLLIDRFKLEQVIINILANAVKFTPRTGVITIETIAGDNDCTIAVQNSGSIVEHADQQKIFEPFFQVAGNKNLAGTGLGLTISKYLVELHGGTISVVSNYDNGEPATTFSIKLPMGVQVTAQNIIPAEDESISQEVDTGKKKSILLVDDNDELLEILREEFADFYKVQTARDGREALKLINLQKPSLIIADVIMPLMTGLELCKLIKMNPATNDIPIILLTAKNTEGAKLAGLEVMANDYITKPFNLKELRYKVKNLIKEQDAIRQSVTNHLQLTKEEYACDTSDEVLLRTVIALIEEHIDDGEFNVEILCREVAMSRSVLYRKVKAITGMSIQNFILEIRLKRAAQLLLTRQHTISEVMYRFGFSSLSYFNRAFKNKFNVSPSDYRKQSN